MDKFLKELIKGIKWVFIMILSIIFIIGSWISCAWSLGWLIYRFFDLQNFGPDNFIAFGSCALVLVLLIQIITIILTAWALLAWGRSHGLMNKEHKKIDTGS